MDKALVRLLEAISSCGTPILRCANNIRELKGQSKHWKAASQCKLQGAYIIHY